MKRIIVTRSLDDVDRLAKRLASAGYSPIKLPLLAIEATANTVHLGNMPPETSSLIFTSVNAVRYGLSKTAEAIKQAGLAVIAVGSKTRDELHMNGVLAECPDREDSEGVLALLADLPQLPTHILLVKGQGGRDLIESRVPSLGIQLSTFECYRRVWPDIPKAVFTEAVAPDKPGLIHIASGETMVRLTDLCRSFHVEVQESHHLIVPSQRVADQARELGWHSRIVAAGAGDDALLQVMKQLS